MKKGRSDNREEGMNGERKEDRKEIKQKQQEWVVDRMEKKKEVCLG